MLSTLRRFLGHSPSSAVFHKILISGILLLLLSCFSRVRLLATPWTAAYQAPPSMGFSRQEYWSGVPLPFPKHESEKWKWSHSVMSDSSRPHGLQPSRLLHPWDFPGNSTGVGCHCLLLSGIQYICLRTVALGRSQAISIFKIFPLLPTTIIAEWCHPHGKCMP